MATGCTSSLRVECGRRLAHRCEMSKGGGAPLQGAARSHSPVSASQPLQHTHTHTRPRSTPQRFARSVVTTPCIVCLGYVYVCFCLCPELGPLKWGIAKVICNAQTPPIVQALYHLGFEKVRLPYTTTTTLLYHCHLQPITTDLVLMATGYAPSSQQ